MKPSKQKSFNNFTRNCNLNNPKIDLVLFDNDGELNNWAYGNIFHTRFNIKNINTILNEIMQRSSAEYILFFHNKYTLPELNDLIEIIKSPGDLWHGGISFYKQAELSFLGSITPINMLLLNPDPLTNATSWKISFRKCLIKTNIISSFFPLDENYSNPDWATLDFGFSSIQSGVFPRHSIHFNFSTTEQIKLPQEDISRFLKKHFSPFWGLWCILFTNPKLLTRYLKLMGTPIFKKQIITVKSHPLKSSELTLTPKISIVLPTIERSKYLLSVLSQLQSQTILPFQTIVVDQSLISHSQDELSLKFPDINLQYISITKKGQSNARNIAIEKISGDYVLFLDDDVEISNHLIEDHYKSIVHFNCDASIGFLNEPETKSVPTTIRISDIFPTSNSLITREILKKTQLFDSVFNFGPRADLDFGIQIYLAGGLLVFNPNISLYHYRAPMGGLRSINARKITLSSSKASIWRMHLIHPTEVYLLLKFFGTKNLAFMCAIRLLGTVRYNGNIFFKFVKYIYAILLLPTNICKIFIAVSKGYRFKNLNEQ